MKLSSAKKSAIYEALGSASMCWVPRPSKATFDSEECEGIGDNLVAILEAEDEEDRLRRRLAEIAGYAVSDDFKMEQRYIEDRLATIDVEVGHRTRPDVIVFEIERLREAHAKGPEDLHRLIGSMMMSVVSPRTSQSVAARASEAFARDLIEKLRKYHSEGAEKLHQFVELFLIGYDA